MVKLKRGANSRGLARLKRQKPEGRKALDQRMHAKPGADVGLCDGSEVAGLFAGQGPEA